jgi:hypothetical protein
VPEAMEHLLRAPRKLESVEIAGRGVFAVGIGSIGCEEFAGEENLSAQRDHQTCAGKEGNMGRGE